MHHITHIKNLKSILNCGYLKARNFLNDNSFTDTANSAIILKRENVDGENLNNYVPLHCDFLQEQYGINYNYNVCCKYGSKNMIFLIFPQEIIKNYNSLFYVFHPISNHKIKITNWSSFTHKILEEHRLLEKREDGKPNFKSDKVQDFFTSEILIKNEIELKDLKKIIVSNEETKLKVLKILKECGLKDITVEIKKCYFQI